MCAKWTKTVTTYDRVVAPAMMSRNICVCTGLTLAFIDQMTRHGIRYRCLKDEYQEKRQRSKTLNDAKIRFYVSEKTILLRFIITFIQSPAVCDSYSFNRDQN